MLVVVVVALAVDPTRALRSSPSSFVLVRVCATIGTVQRGGTAADRRWTGRCTGRSSPATLISRTG